LITFANHTLIFNAMQISKSTIILLLFSLFSFSVYALPQYDIVVAADGSGQYKTIQQAIDAVPNNKGQKTIIFVKKGVYTEKVIVPSSKTNITLLGEDVQNTIVTWNDYTGKVVGQDTVTTWSSATFTVDAEGFVAENITFENSAGRVGQAVAVRVIADMVMFRNCRFLGNQDTLFAHGIGRIYFKDCYIEGTTDFIFGSAIALFETCTIHNKTNSYITAASTPMGNAYGYVFDHCKLTADTSVKKVFLGRPWRAYAKTVYLYCEMGAHIRAEGWDNWRSTDKEKTTFYAEYKNTGPGANPAARVPWSKQLADTVAANYTMEKIFARSSVPVPVPMLRSWMPGKE
jgi:pectinesterase